MDSDILLIPDLNAACSVMHEDPDAEPLEDPDLHYWLLSHLSDRRREYEEQFDFGAVEKERAFKAALAAMNERAYQLISTGAAPSELTDALVPYRTGDSLKVKLRSLLELQLVQHRLEFDVAEDICTQLSGLPERVNLIALLTAFLVDKDVSATSIKYFERARRLFLAGYSAETIIMCGAVLEAALAARFPDELLRHSGNSPKFARIGVFTVGQRMAYEAKHPVWRDDQRARAWKLIHWRNDAVHVQPDLGPDPEDAILHLAVVLPGLVDAAT